MCNVNINGSISGNIYLVKLTIPNANDSIIWLYVQEDDTHK